MEHFKLFGSKKRSSVLAAALAGVMLAGCGNAASNTGTAPAPESAQTQSGVSSSENTADQSAKTEGSEAAKTTVEEKAPVEVSDAVLPKSEGGNPIIQLKDEQGRWIYGGDPAVYVDGDTAYLYTGHDMSTDVEVSEAAYHIPEYFCYSSTDLLNWKPEGVVMHMKDVSWAKDHISAWASQVIKHDDKYYLYFCSWDKTGGGKQSIGVAVSDSPTGPFVDIGKPLVMGVLTKPQTSAWNDIDPTVWVETDEEGVEHRYLAWGNALFYICELNPDMVSVTDQNGDGKITCGVSLGDADIQSSLKGLLSYTEAPWLYRRSDENGQYYGDYYLFYASGWRESMAYSTTTDLINGTWENSNVFMLPSATCNTNHEAIFDFKGKTYMMYHDGAQPGGNGYRRSACLQELIFNDDGSISMMEESASGLGGTISTIWHKGEVVCHAPFDNSVADADYPYLDIAVGMGLSDQEKDSQWVIVQGKADETDETLVSIQSENKTGLYLTVTEENEVVLAQDIDASEDTAIAQTFRSVTALDGTEGACSFRSMKDESQYLTIAADGVLTLSDGSDAAAATFTVE